MKVVVTGAAGQLGDAVCSRFASVADVVALARKDCDLSRPDQVAGLADLEPAVIINCAAWTDVDGAQDHPLEALDANAIGVSRLARAAARTGATLVHISTDFVFDGEQDRPHREDDTPRPRGTYALTKLLGEALALEHPQTYVLRVESLFGGARAKSSIDRIIDGLAAGSTVTVFSDRTVSPTFTLDAAEAIASLVDRRAPFGLYHCVNTGFTTWEGIGKEVLALTGSSGVLDPVPMSSRAMPVPRPLYCALSNDKLRAAGIPMPSWQDALARHLRSRGALRPT